MVKLIISPFKPASCNNCYGAICLPPAGAPLPHGKACLVSGWGVTEYDQSGQQWFDATRILQEVSVNVMSNEYCRDHTNPGQANTVIDGQEFCAGLPDEDFNGLTDGNGVESDSHGVWNVDNGGKSACKGDIGGPLTCVFDDQPVLTGIVSWGLGCAYEGYPDVYVDVAQYVDWIEETMETLPTTTPPPTPPPGFEERPDKIQEGLQCTKDARIVGGQDAKQGSYPWQVNIEILSQGDGVRLCGASILSENWVVTAAHW